MTDEQPKQDLKFSILTYVGKAWVKDFPPNEDGTVTKSFKYLFKKTAEDQFTRTFWGYDTTKGVETLSEGSKINIGYIEKPNPKGDSPLKIARFFGVPSEAQLLAESKPEPVQAKTPLPKMEFDIAAWAVKYRENPKKEMTEKTLPDFVGNFIKRTNPELYESMKKLYDEVVCPKVAE